MTENKKSVHVIEKYFYPVTAGIEVNIGETYSKIANRDLDITIHTSTDTLTEKRCLPENEIIKNLKVKRYEYKFFGYWPDIEWSTADYVCLHNFNVFPHLLIMLYTLYLKFFGRKKYSLFLTPHGGFNPEWRVFPTHIAILKRAYHYTIGVLLINLTVDGVRAVSKWEKSEMVKRGINTKKIIVIENGIEDEAYLDLDKSVSEEYKKKVESYGKYIIQIGRVYPIKNYETVIKAMVNVPKDVKYLIVGPVEINRQEGYKNKLDRLIKELGLENRVIFTGVIKGAEKYYLIKKAQMMVHMAIWESFCNVVHEGLSQGLVCIVANNTALPLLIQNNINGYCLETYNYNAVATKINYVLNNKVSDEIRTMQNTNIKYGLQNSWAEVAERMYKFYIYTHEGKLEQYEG